MFDNKVPQLHATICVFRLAIDLSGHTEFSHLHFFRDEYSRLFEFVKSKHLRVKNIGNKVSTLS